jgi:hypothetical protein
MASNTGTAQDRMSRILNKHKETREKTPGGQPRHSFVRKPQPKPIEDEPQNTAEAHFSPEKDFAAWVAREARGNFYARRDLMKAGRDIIYDLVPAYFRKIDDRITSGVNISTEDHVKLKRYRIQWRRSEGPGLTGTGITSLARTDNASTDKCAVVVHIPEPLLTFVLKVGEPLEYTIEISGKTIYLSYPGVGGVQHHRLTYQITPESRTITQYSVCPKSLHHAVQFQLSHLGSTVLAAFNGRTAHEPRVVVRASAEDPRLLGLLQEEFVVLTLAVVNGVNIPVKIILIKDSSSACGNCGITCLLIKSCSLRRVHHQGCDDFEHFPCIPCGINFCTEVALRAHRDHTILHRMIALHALTAPGAEAAESTAEGEGTVSDAPSQALSVLPPSEAPEREVGLSQVQYQGLVNTKKTHLRTASKPNADGSHQDIRAVYHRLVDPKKTGDGREPTVKDPLARCTAWQRKNLVKCLFDLRTELETKQKKAKTLQAQELAQLEEAHQDNVQHNIDEVTAELLQDKVDSVTESLARDIKALAALRKKNEKTWDEEEAEGSQHPRMPKKPAHLVNYNALNKHLGPNDTPFSAPQVGASSVTPEWLAGASRFKKADRKGRNLDASAPPFAPLVPWKPSSERTSSEASGGSWKNVDRKANKRAKNKLSRQNKVAEALLVAREEQAAREARATYKPSDRKAPKGKDKGNKKKPYE